MTLPPSHPILDGRTTDAPLVRAYRGQLPQRTPVWFMRQAGRSLPEYRELRAGGDMLAACLDPAMVTEITLQPVRRHGVDAAILFSDIVIPVLLAGVDVSIVPGRGPVFATPVRTAADVAALPTLEDDALEPIRQAVALLVAELGATPLIAFAGAPFTLASYMVEGGPSKDQMRARTLMMSDPQAWSALLDWCAGVSGAFLRAQVAAGASAAQVFDSWVGSLSRETWRTSVARHTARTFAALDGLEGLSVPRVHFGLGSASILDLAPGLGADAVGVDWRTPLDEAARIVPGWPLQGNIDPAVLGAPWEVVEAHVLDVLRRGRFAPAHVLNLGHGVPPETDPTVLTRIVELVHAQGAPIAAAPVHAGAQVREEAPTA
ncbi:uroporphyrinogen decarboxylase [Litorihabitans aurantiacus]|uniref:Uroporphyrinogen decarboxylase n=1 Tax=Litorihabitans aurantiacus TaxID=1930061 RepID=A0AA37XDU8_9MICO|nr:uroporphyrinogen decarboxylase [Litorihabitans aurantiacus]GMA31232.1 uroporphyrinogen decarboxylase [Litorihabitans aurantiacus]